MQVRQQALQLLLRFWIRRIIVVHLGAHRRRFFCHPQKLTQLLEIILQ
jgi:hypothetical protein